MRLSATFVALALSTMIAVDAAPLALTRSERRLLTAATPSKDPALLSAGVDTDGRDGTVRLGLDLCMDPLLGLIECTTTTSSKADTKTSSKAKANTAPVYNTKARPKKAPNPEPLKPAKKPHHTNQAATPQRANNVGGSAHGGNGGSAPGGSSDCSMGNSLVGISALNINSCNGGNGGDASGGSAIGGHGGPTTILGRDVLARNQVGGSATGGAGGNASGGDGGSRGEHSALLGDASVLNIGSGNGGDGGDAQGGSAVGGHGGPTTVTGRGRDSHASNRGPSIKNDSDRLVQEYSLLGRESPEEEDDIADDEALADLPEQPALE